MQLSFFKSVENRDTPLHRLDGRLKTVFFLVCIVVATVISHWYLALFLWFAAMGAFTLLGLPKRYLLSRLSMPFGISWLVFLSLMFTNGSHPLWVMMTSPFLLTVYSEGIQLGFLMMLRIMAAVTLASVLSFSTPMVEILETLRFFKIPGIMVDIADLMIRYVYLLDETAHKMRQAQMSRTTGKLSWVAQIQNAGKVAGYVLLKSIDRSIKIYNSMLARGYNQESTAPVYFTRPVSATDLKKGMFLMLFPIATLAVNYWI
jgi:cobalt/nickel transport system permease protein